MWRINDEVFVREEEVEERFVRASGPGGQNVNKVATAVQLRYDVERASGLPEEVRARLKRLAGRRLSADGVLVIDARRFRTQERNRDDALQRLLALVRAATERPKPRRATRPTLGSKKRRLRAKRERGETKRLRGRVPKDD